MFDSPPPAPDPRGGKGEEAGRRPDLAEEGHAAARSRERGGGGGVGEREERAAGKRRVSPERIWQRPSFPHQESSSLPFLALSALAYRGASHRSRTLERGRRRGGEGERVMGWSTAVGEA
jgi:hypothetical protein